MGIDIILKSSTIFFNEGLIFIQIFQNSVESKSAMIIFFIYTSIRLFLICKLHFEIYINKL